MNKFEAEPLNERFSTVKIDAPHARDPNGVQLYKERACSGIIVQYDVLIPVTQIMSFVCKQTVRKVVCIKKFRK